MSWNITHQCRFQSRTHQQYCVNISKQSDVSVEIKQLIGSEHPFVTSEANGDDIFLPVRQQTGYLRVLDNSGGTLIEELLPENNTQKMVTLINLTTGKTEWIGFLAAEVFTQPWEKDLTELEFPLKSALACLSDVTIQKGVTGTNRLAMLVYNAFSSLFGDNNVPFTEIVLMDDFYTVCDQLLMRANFGIFFEDETVMNDNTETSVRVGDTYMNAIKEMCQVFGLSLRQQSTALVFGRYDNGGNFRINVNILSWDILASIHNSTSWPTVQSQGSIITRDLLPITDFMANNNKQTFLQGGKNAIVTLDLVSSQRSNNVITLPQSEIKEGGIERVAVGSEGSPYLYEILRNTYGWLQYRGRFDIQKPSTFYFQVDTGTRSTESFYYLHSAIRVDEVRSDKVDDNFILTVRKNLWGSWGNSSREVVFTYTIFDKWGLTNYFDEMYTGAIPGRWGKEGGILENGLYLIQYVKRSSDDATGSALCYSIWNDEETEITNGFLNINFNIEETFITIFNQYTYEYLNQVSQREGYAVNTRNNSFVSGSFNLLKNGIEYQMQCLLRSTEYGVTWYWNGSTWQNTYAEFSIPVKNGSIVSNYNQSMNIDNIGGIFVPIDVTAAKFKFDILNIVYCDSTMAFTDNVTSYKSNSVEFPVYPFQRILSGLTIDIVYPRDVTVSSRGSNVYRKTIMEMGFSEDKEKSLKIGTWNNNVSSPSLLRTYNNDGYVESVDYAAADGTTVSERPEMHLLNRMVEQYKTMRRTMEAKIATGIDIFRQRFSYNGRKFMAIDKKHDWEREEQEVKFIEVN